MVPWALDKQPDLAKLWTSLVTEERDRLTDRDRQKCH